MSTTSTLLRALGVVARRPRLWPTAVTMARRTTPKGWWRRKPFLPVPSRDYVAFRLTTQYGDGDSRPTTDDLVAYLAWCRDGTASADAPRPVADSGWQAGRVSVRLQAGSAGALHALDPFAAGAAPVETPTVWRCEADRRALVLGSRQRPDLLDVDACESAGVEVAHRRSGGGAVLIVPGDIVWLDLVLPAGWWPDDVRRSMVLAGRCWVDALVASGIAAERLTVHTGGMVASPWSQLVCFAGLGPGEVLFDGRKLVGLSQRRSRHGVRIQGLVHRRSELASMRALFAGDVPGEPLEEPAVLPWLDAGGVAVALARRATERHI